MSEAAVAEPPAQSFDDFISGEIGQGLEKEQLETLQAKHPTQEPVQATPTTKPVETGTKLVDEPKPAKTPTETDWKEALEFSKDLDKTPASPKDPPLEKYAEKPPGVATEKASNAWASLRHRATQADALEKANQEMAARIKAFEEQTAGLADKEIVPKDIWAKNLRDQEELTSSLRVTNLEATPEYRQTVSLPMQQIRDQAKLLAERYHVPIREMFNALDETDENRQADMLSDLAETGQFKEKSKMDLFRYGDQMRNLNATRAKLHENVGKTLEVIEHQRRMGAEAQAKKIEADWGQALDRSWQTLEKGIWMFQKSETDQEWNQSLDALKQTVRGVQYNKLPMEKQAQILYQAAMVPRVLKALVEARDRILSQEEALKKYSASTPGAGAGGSAESAPVSSADSGLGFVEAMTR
jgi:hypothetical protein